MMSKERASRFSGKLPVIEYFKANMIATIEGLPVILNWKVHNALKIIIVPDVGRVPPEGSIYVKPLEDTSYTLTAINHRDGCSRTLKIKANKPPEIRLMPSPWRNLTVPIQITPLILNKDLNLNPELKIPELNVPELEEDLFLKELPEIEATVPEFMPEKFWDRFYKLLDTIHSKLRKLLNQPKGGNI